MENTPAENTAPAKTENNENKRASNFSVPLAIVAAGVLVAGAILFVGFGGNGDGASAAAVGGAETAPEISITKDDHILGNPDAPIILVEFSDLECPFCKSFHQTMKRVMEEYGGDGKVAWVYKHFPIDSIHPKARKEAAAAECAARLGGAVAFWEYTDRIFAVTPSNNGLDPNLLPKIAEEIGLKKDDFNSCLATSAESGIDKRIQENLDEGIAAGVRGTPFTVIISKNGAAPTPINGAQAFETVKAMIDAALQN